MTDVQSEHKNSTPTSVPNAQSSNMVSERQDGENAVQAVGDAGDPTGTDQVQPEQQQGGMGSMIKGLLFRAFIIYMISSMFRRGGQPEQNTTVGPDGKQSLIGPSQNAYQKHFKMDLHVYVAETEKFTNFSDSELFWFQPGLEYGDWESGAAHDGTYSHSGKLTTTQGIKNNGTVYIHVYITRAGKSPDPKNKEFYARGQTMHITKQLNKYKRKKYMKTHNLLTGETEANPMERMKVENGTTVEILSHWHENLTINLVDDHTPWTQGKVPQPLDQYIHFNPAENKYLPILYINDYWNLLKDYQPINETVDELPLHLTYSPISLFRWQMYAAQGMRNQWMGGMNMLQDMMGEQETEEDQDQLKIFLLETSFVIVAITITVTIVHTIFDFLAFKNDVQFWNSRKSLEGLSINTVFFQVFANVVVFLYILDNDTNMMIILSVFIGLCIELWKIPKCVNVKLDRENKLLGLLPRIRLEDKSTYTESSTKEYDRLAFKYLSWALFPLLAGYAVYSLLYQEHKGWYSWSLSMVYGFLLTFGFIMMTPQLFINYKLKSVPHLPWRMLTYKALNTFIDDLFAFVMHTPMLYRIGCFRDDIVFFIYLYQRWIYRVDPKRVNEFGVSGDDLAAAAAATAGSGQSAVAATQPAITGPADGGKEKTE